MSAAAQSLFDKSMEWLDSFYDPTAGYLFDPSATTALRHEVRQSTWYAVGLLSRNQGTDVAEANKIFANVVKGQYVADPSWQWYVRFSLCSLIGLG